MVQHVFKFAFCRQVLPAVLAGMLAIPPATANELADLKMQLQDLSRRLEILEQKRDQRRLQKPEGEAQAIDHVESDPGLRGTWQIPGTNTSLGISGFVRAHMIYDIGPRPTSGGGDVASIHRAILEDTPEFENRGDVRIAGRDARFTIETFTPSVFGSINTFIQTDFKGDPDEKASRDRTNRTAANVRHAYAEVGNFLFGHTYSAYLDNTVFGDKVDPTGPQGRTMIRQAQIRYTHHFDDERKWAFAIENPHADFVDADDDNLHDGYPDLAMHYRHETDNWMYQFGAMVRRVGIKQVDPIPADDRAFSWGLNTSGRYWFNDRRNRITWYFNFGDGIGRYLEAGRDQGASITPDGKLDTQFGYGGFVTFKHMWTDTLSSNFDLGMGFYDLNQDEDPEANKQLMSSHMNLIWTPFRQVEMGLEYVWGRREVRDGRVGKVNRIVVNTQFNF